MSDILGGALDFLLGEDDSSSEEDPRDLTADEEIMTDLPERIFVTFGEIFFRYFLDGSEEAVLNGTRRLGSAELDLAIALLNTGGNGAEIFTVLPSSGGHVEYVKKVVEKSGVGLRYVSGRSDTMGDVTVFPDGARIFQRDMSAFASMNSHPFQWEKGIVADRIPCWVHLCYSSVGYSDAAKETWVQLMEVAIKAENAWTSLELDIGNLPSISAANFGRIYLFVLPYLARVELLILTVAELWAFVEVTKLPISTDDSISHHVQQLREFLACKCLAIVVPNGSNLPATLLASHKSGQFIEKHFDNQNDERRIIASLIQALTTEPHFTNVDEFAKIISKKLSGSATPNEAETIVADSMAIYKIE